MLGRGQTCQALLAEGVEVVDVGAGADLAQPLDIVEALVAFEPEALGQVGADVHVVPALVHRLDRLAHEDGVVPRPAPWRMDVAPLPERGRRQDDVRVPRRRRQEVIVDDHELEPLESRRRSC